MSELVLPKVTVILRGYETKQVLSVVEQLVGTRVNSIEVASNSPHAMESISVGVAYSIWTGIGAVMTVIAGVVLYKDRIDRMKVLFIFLIIVGVVGLEMSSEVSL